MYHMRFVWNEDRERLSHQSFQPALAYEDASWLESLAKSRMAAMADSLLVLVPDKTLHGIISISIQ